jgi:SGF29 tudor-like domain
MQTEENGSWILATVVRYIPNLDRYDVRDEDEER